METGHTLDGRYQILGPIAEGASSTVWEARDGETGETVAVKAVSMERAGWRAEVRDRFQQEARLLTLVQNPHVVGVRAHGETDEGDLYLVLDRLSGETLADRLARPPRLSWREAAAVAAELGRGLGALHARGVIHRDLKPANVILHDDGSGAPAVYDGGLTRSSGALPPPKPPVAKLIDLGISKASAAAADPVLFATLTATGQVLGTPEYMSREQALGERDVDARADVWAVGVVLYEMIAGRRPFSGANVNAVLAAIRRGPPPPLRTVARDAPEALARVVARCLDPSRDARYADGNTLAEAIEAAVRKAEQDEMRAARMRKLRVVLAAGAALLAVAGGAALLSRRAPARTDASTSVAPAAPLTVVTTAATAVVTAPAKEKNAATPPVRSMIVPPAPSGAASAGRRPVTQVNSAGF